ncbi:hypothetical protein BJ742DRAFT_813000 [Cladochytrium replicatum]|nr:hypothetical protein BJ742DRAFT_813000 [Cladochytrium replicatum]
MYILKHSVYMRTTVRIWSNYITFPQSFPRFSTIFVANFHSGRQTQKRHDFANAAQSSGVSGTSKIVGSRSSKAKTTSGTPLSHESKLMEAARGGDSAQAIFVFSKFNGGLTAIDRARWCGHVLQSHSALSDRKPRKGEAESIWHWYLEWSKALIDAFCNQLHESKMRRMQDKPWGSQQTFMQYYNTTTSRSSFPSSALPDAPYVFFSTIFPSILRILLYSDHVVEAQILARERGNVWGFELEPIEYIHFIRAFARLRRTAEAEHWFADLNSQHTMDQSTLSMAYEALLSAYSATANVDAVEQIVRAMNENNLRISLSAHVRVANSYIHFMEKKGVAHSNVTAALSHSSSKSNSSKNEISLLRKLLEYLEIFKRETKVNSKIEVLPAIASIHLLLRQPAEAKKFTSEVINQIIDNHFKLRFAQKEKILKVVSKLLHYHAIQGDFLSVSHIFSQFQMYPALSLHKNLSARTEIITAYVHFHDIHGALSELEKLDEVGIVPDPHVLSILLRGIFSSTTVPETLTVKPSFQLNLKLPPPRSNQFRCAMSLIELFKRKYNVDPSNEAHLAIIRGLISPTPILAYVQPGWSTIVHILNLKAAIEYLRAKFDQFSDARAHTALITALLAIDEADLAVGDTDVQNFDPLSEAIILFEELRQKLREDLTTHQHSGPTSLRDLASDKDQIVSANYDHPRADLVAYTAFMSGLAQRSRREMRSHLHIGPSRCSSYLWPENWRARAYGIHHNVPLNRTPPHQPHRSLAPEYIERIIESTFSELTTLSSVLNPNKPPLDLTKVDSIRSQLAPDSTAHNVLLAAHVNARSYEKAVLLFNKMVNERTTVTAETITLMVKAYTFLSNGSKSDVDPDIVPKLFHSMTQSSTAPELLSLNSLMLHFAARRDIDSGMRVANLLRSVLRSHGHGTAGVVPIFTTLIHGIWQDAKKTVRGMMLDENGQDSMTRTADDQLSHEEREEKVLMEARGKIVELAKTLVEMGCGNDLDDVWFQALADAGVVMRKLDRTGGRRWIVRLVEDV